MALRVSHHFQTKPTQGKRSPTILTVTVWSIKIMRSSYSFIRNKLFSHQLDTKRKWHPRWVLFLFVSTLQKNPRWDISDVSKVSLLFLYCKSEIIYPAETWIRNPIPVPKSTWSLEWKIGGNLFNRVSTMDCSHQQQKWNNNMTITTSVELYSLMTLW